MKRTTKKTTIFASLLLATTVSFAQVEVTSSSNLGVGTTTPAHKLHVVGTSYVNGDSYCSGNFGLGTTAPLTKFQIGNIWTFYDGTSDKEICRNARYASGQYWRINTGASSLISFTGNGDIFFRTSPSGTANAVIPFNDVVIKSNGNFGIGTQNPLEKLHINLYDAGRKVLFGGWTNAYIDFTGNNGSACFYPAANYYLQIGKNAQRVAEIYAGNVLVSWNVVIDSDTRLKENIEVLENPLQKLMRVSAYNYNFKKEFLPEGFSAEATTKLAKKQIGFLAQELEKEFPELVNTPDKENEHYGVNYIGMIPVLLEAIKEQQKMIETQQQKIETQQQRIEALEKGYSSNNTLKSGDASTSSATTSTATQELYLSDNVNSETLKLYQNAPNPFNQRTTVKSFVPEQFQKVQLCVYNMQGVQVQCITITERGNVSIEIEAGKLSAGVYSYVLLADGAASETKQMILTK